MADQVDRHHPELINRDYVVLGLLTHDAARLPTRPTTLAALEPHVTKFREEIEEDEATINEAMMESLGFYDEALADDEADRKESSPERATLLARLAERLSPPLSTSFDSSNT